MAKGIVSMQDANLKKMSIP